MIKNLPAMRERQVWSLGQEDLLEKGMAAYSSIPAWRIPWTEKTMGFSPWIGKESDTTEQPTSPGQGCFKGIGSAGGTRVPLGAGQAISAVAEALDLSARCSVPAHDRLAHLELRVLHGACSYSWKSWGVVTTAISLQELGSEVPDYSSLCGALCEQVKLD